jgi:hypothetical protein
MGRLEISGPPAEKLAEETGESEPPGHAARAETPSGPLPVKGAARFETQLFGWFSLARYPLACHIHG